MSEKFPFFAFTTQEDIYGEIQLIDSATNGPISLEGRSFEMAITPASTGRTVTIPVKTLTMANGGGLSLKPGDPSTITFRVPRDQAVGFARQEYTADILELVGPDKYLFMPVRFQYSDPAGLRQFLSRLLGVKVSFANRLQPIIMPMPVRGAPGADGATILFGTQPPTALTGRNNDFYIQDRSADGLGRLMYGPKTGGSWSGPYDLDVVGALRYDRALSLSPAQIVRGRENLGLGADGNLSLYSFRSKGGDGDFYKAQSLMSGGGFITWGGIGNKFLWTNQFIAMPVGSVSVPGFDNYIRIPPITAAIPVDRVKSPSYAGARAVDAGGIVLNAWEALYYEHDVGGAPGQGRFWIYGYGGNYNPQPNFILVAAANADDGTLKLGTGQTLRPSSTRNFSVKEAYALTEIVGADQVNNTSDLTKAQPGNPVGDAIRAALYPVIALGYIGDGQRHPLSSVTRCQGVNTTGWSLEQWKNLFPRALALTDEIDGHACQKFWDLRPKGGRLRLPDGFGYSSYEIKTGKDQAVGWSGTHRDACGLIFLNSVASGIESFGISHGRQEKANGTFFMEKMSILCSGGKFGTALTVRFSGEQFDEPWCYVLDHVMMKGLNYSFFAPPAPPNLDYWSQGTVTYDIVRGLSWYDVVSITPNPEINFADHHTLIVEYVNRASNSYNYFNCCCYGGAYAWKFNYDGVAVTQTHEEAQFWNCQGYDVIGLCSNIASNLGAPYADNWTFYECQCACRGGAIYTFSRTELVTIVGGLYGNNTPMNNYNTFFARISNCAAFKIYWPHIINSDFGGAAQNFYHIYIEGPGTKEIVVRDYTVTNYGNFGAFVGIASNVQARAYRDSGVQFNAGGPEPTIAWVDDQSNSQLSELRLRKAFHRAKELTYVSQGATLTVDEECVATIVDSFTAQLDGNGGVARALSPGLVRKPPMVLLSNADITPRGDWVGAAAVGQFPPVDDNDAMAYVRVGYAGGAGKWAKTTMLVSWRDG